MIDDVVGGAVMLVDVGEGEVVVVEAAVDDDGVGKVVLGLESDARSDSTLLTFSEKCWILSVRLPARMSVWTRAMPFLWIRLWALPIRAITASHCPSGGLLVWVDLVHGRGDGLRSVLGIG